MQTEDIVCSVCKITNGETKTLDKIFSVIGYSVREGGTGITCGYEVDLSALAYYESKAGKIEFGIIIVNASDAVKNGIVNEEYALISGIRGLQVEMTGRIYRTFNVNITGFSTSLKSLDLIITAYVIADSDGDGVTEISFIQHTMSDKDNAPVTAGGYTLNTISVNRALGIALPPQQSSNISDDE